MKYDVLGLVMECSRKEIYSSYVLLCEQYKVERSWVLGMIVDGMREYDDYKICERRFLLKVLLSLYDSPLGDTQTQVSCVPVLGGSQSQVIFKHRCIVFQYWIRVRVIQLVSFCARSLNGHSHQIVSVFFRSNPKNDRPIF